MKVFEVQNKNDCQRKKKAKTNQNLQDVKIWTLFIRTRQHSVCNIQTRTPPGRKRVSDSSEQFAVVHLFLIYTRLSVCRPVKGLDAEHVRTVLSCPAKKGSYNYVNLLCLWIARVLKGKCSCLCLFSARSVYSCAKINTIYCVCSRQAEIPIFSELLIFLLRSTHSWLSLWDPS